MKLISVLIFLLIISAQINAQDTYAITDLGILNPKGINDSGQVSGSSGSGVNQVAIRWENGITTEYPTLGGGFTLATGINNYGVMSGYSSDFSGRQHAVIFKDDSIYILPDPMNISSEAFAINDSGYVAGQVKFCDSCDNAAVWNGGDPINLGSFSRFGSYSKDINYSGLVVGYGEAPPTFNDNAFKTTGAGLINLGTLGGNDAKANAVNNLGHIVGSSRDASGNGHAVIWNPGIHSIQNPGTFGGEAYDINDSNVVVGSFGNRAFVWENGVMKDLNTICDTTGGWVLQNAVAINNLGQIVGWGLLNGQQRAFLLTLKPLFKITKPTPYSKFIAGETDTIKWTGGQAGQFLNIEYSDNNGSTYNLIDIAVPADSNYFIWDIPVNILTTEAKIKITDLMDSTITAVSDSFKIKGYVLTRLDANNQYVAFSPAAHGWQYLNGTLYPQSWWNQFQYATGNDPNTNELYPSFFHPIPASSFIDWPLWVEVFGIDQCYYWTSAPLLGPNYKGDAQEKWKSNANPHNGSCFGFAASSFLAFNFRDLFFQKHQGIPNVSNVFSLNLTNTIQKTINGYYAYQYGKQSLDNDVIGQPKNPRTTLLEIMNMFKGDSLNIRTITIYNNNGNGGGAHTMAPISVTKDGSGPSRYRVNLYDSNNPGLNTPYIMVDSINNTWTDFTGLGITWAGNSHFYLEIPVSNYLNTPVMGKQLLKPKGTANIEFYNSEKANVMFTNSSGQKMGVTNGVVTDELQDGIAIFNKNGKPSDPIGYYIPDDNYSVVLSNITDTSGRAFFSAFKQNVIYNYERGNVNVSQSDKFRIDEGFSVISQDLEDKQINLSVIAKLDSSERILFVQQTQLKQNDSLYLRETNQSEFIIKNYGTAKTYKLEINERSFQEQEIFQNLSLSLQENSSHTIQPNWADLDGSILNVLVDLGNDGTIDDTLSLANQVTGIGEDQGSLLTPNSYNLAQNYPNPFNPTTKISWQSPVGSHQTLKIYDVLGNEVATLVNEYREAGKYEVEFNGHSDEGQNLSSGVYFYRLQAGSFVETKKMILLR